MATHFLHRTVQVAIETEATQGTAETLASGDVTFRVGADASFVLDNETHVQDLMTATDLSELPDLIGNRPVTITFSTLINGSGAAGTAPGWREAMIHGGFLETINAGVSAVYTPETPVTTNSATIGVWYGPTTSTSGRLLQAKGCRMQSMSIEITAGAPVKATWVYRGAFVSATDASVVSSSPSYDATVPQTARSLGLTIGSWTPFFSALTVNVNNTVAAVVNPGATSEASGISHYEITARRVDGSITFMDVLTSVQNWRSDLLAGTEAALTLTLGATGGNKVTIAAPKMQLLTAGPTELEGIHGQTVACKFNRSSGDDELSITQL